MSYQVLARKWRPKTFREMVAQEHVLKALVNALDHDRLHHAYLFTGTRGVGKTTIARILAKSLNCETGISSSPCGVCSACVEIDEGRFVDLIEVDAASRTKVEDTREMLDNVQYSPTRGRYKVYLIDEVHMLSGHSFNALLKTLEEPPEHVKFLLATTDPQKLPVTILSRCLQFSLKAMSPERIVGHLQHVLGAESVEYEEPALWALARSADGSMRDAMSLTDQAISFGNGKVLTSDVSAMLGTIDRGYVLNLLRCLSESDGAQLLAVIKEMAEQAPDFSAVLADLISTLHRVAMAQIAPDAIDNSDGTKAQIQELAQLFTAESVQLFYQTALLGRRDLPLAPDTRSGFEMVLLRMLLFKPAQVDVIAPAAPTAQEAAAPVKKPETRKATSALQAALEQQSKQQQPHEPAQAPAPKNALERPPALEQPVTPTDVAPAAASLQNTPAAQPEAIQSEPTSPETTIHQTAPAQPPAEQPKQAASPTKNKPEAAFGDRWADLLQQLALNDVIQHFARCLYLDEESDSHWAFSISPKNELMLQSQRVEQLQQAVSEYLGKQVKLRVDIAQPAGATPQEQIAARRKARLEEAEAALLNDPFVQTLTAHFGASLDKESLTNRRES